MCDKKPYCGTRIDPCLQGIINMINDNEYGIRTISSCCGHGKYPRTILTHNKETGLIKEWFSGTTIALSPRKSHKYYKKDKDGFYYLPELTPCKKMDN